MPQQLNATYVICNGSTCTSNCNARYITALLQGLLSLFALHITPDATLLPMMDLTSLQWPLQLLCSSIITQKILPYTLPLLPLQLTLVAVIYLGITLSVVLPFKVLIYQPFLSPLRHVPDAPSELNNWKTWLAAEPSPPQLLQWVKRVEGYAGFEGMMRYRGIGGNERILVCKSPALKDVLVTQQYSHFDRPAMARKRIAVQAGNGLIASSGDIHKVSID